MCGRFAQAQTREEYLAFLADEAECDIPYDPEPIGRYNVAPTAGSSGKKRETKSSLTLSRAPTDSPFLWRRSAAPRLSAGIPRKGS